MSTNSFSPVSAIIWWSELVRRKTLAPFSNSLFLCCSLFTGTDFPTPKGREVVSQPPNACVNKIFLHTLGPRQLCVLLISHHLVALALVEEKNTSFMSDLTWNRRRMSRSVSSPTRNVTYFMADRSATWTMTQSASPWACCTGIPFSSKHLPTRWMNRCLLVVLERNSSFFSESNMSGVNCTSHPGRVLLWTWAMSLVEGPPKYPSKTTIAWGYDLFTYSTYLSAKCL